MIVVAPVALLLGLAIVYRSWLAAAVAVIVGYLLLARKRRLEFASFGGSIRRSERIALVGLGVAGLIVLIAFGSRFASLSRINEAPPAVVDSFGHPQWTGWLDEIIEENDSAAMRYAAAVSHHLAGDFDGAVRLYERVPDDDRAVRGASAAREGRIEVVMPSGDELMTAMSEGSVREIGGEAASLPSAFQPLFWFTVVVFGSVLLFAAVVSVVPSRDLPIGRGSRVAGWLLPSRWWLRRGRPDLAIVKLFTATFLLVVGVYLIAIWSGDGEAYPAPGILSNWATPNVMSSFPLPDPGDLTRADIPRIYRIALARSYPGAEIFWSLVLLALATNITLRLMSLRDIARTRAIPLSEADTEITPPETLTKPE